MKKLLIIAFIGLLSVSLNAQHVFEKGSLGFNAGIGIPHSYGLIPSINFSGEYGVIPTGDIGLVSFGALAEFQLGHISYNNWGYESQNFPIFYFGPRAIWHVHAFNSDEFDAYGGVGFGIAFNGKTDYVNSSVDVNPDIFVGGRWMFKESMGLFAELGYTGLSSLKVGITFGM